jgi:hypothetical protein
VTDTPPIEDRLAAMEQRIKRIEAYAGLPVWWKDLPTTTTTASRAAKKR